MLDLINKHLTSLTQLIVTLGKYHIHKAKWAKERPNWNKFYSEVRQYANVIRHVNNKKAVKTQELIGKYCPNMTR